MPYRWARLEACREVGEAIATTSACSDAILKAAAWISASNPEPMIPTFTFPLLDIDLPCYVAEMDPSRHDAAPFRMKRTARAQKREYTQRCIHNIHPGTGCLPTSLVGQSVQTSFAGVVWTQVHLGTAADA